jgi:hypothetical protein
MQVHRRAAVTVVALLAAATSAVAATGPANASDEYVAVQPTDDAMAVAQAIATDPGTITGASWVTRPTEGNPTGLVIAPVTGFPTVGTTAGILSTGDATIITQPNDGNSDGQNIAGGSVRGNTDFDVTILKLDFNVPANVNCLTSFDFRFLTEEFPEYVGTSYNDAFIAELDTSTWTTAGSTIIAEDNFAFDPANSVISVNAAGVTSMTAGFGVGTTFDGGTPRLRAKTPITPGPHSLYLSIFDQGDHIYDSAVVIDNLGFGSVGDPATECQTGADVLDPVISDDFVPFSPKRMLETRTGPDHVTFDHQFEKLGKAGPESITRVTIGGRGGVPVDAVGVTMNVTVTEPEGAGHVGVWPCGDEQPTASNLNYAPGQTTANAVVTRVGVGGQVCLFSKAATHLIVDVTGFMPGTTSYTPIVPNRLLDTRPEQGGAGMVAAEGTVEVQVAGIGDVPSDAVAAVLNVTAVLPLAGGYGTLYPCDAPRPVASNLNYTAGSVVPGLVIVKLSEGAAPGKVCVFTKAATHLLVDVAGYFPADSSFRPIVPQRLLDSRGLPTVDGQQSGGGPYLAGQSVPINVRNRATVPPEAVAVSLNVIATETGGAGFLNVYPCGGTAPLASSVNYGPGETRSNAVIAQIGADGNVCVFTKAGAHIVADVTGYFLPG